MKKLENPPVFPEEDEQMTEIIWTDGIIELVCIWHAIGCGYDVRRKKLEEK